MFYYFRLCIFAVVKMDNRNLYTNKQNIMEAKYITLTKENIEKEHICCAFSDKKCKDSYELKKTWLKNEFENGYVFRRLDERAKVFIEYGPAEKAWVPVNAPNYLMINCFWVSGKYKGCSRLRILASVQIQSAAQRKGKESVYSGFKRAYGRLQVLHTRPDQIFLAH